MVILGIHIGHDSCAAIIKDGIIMADVQEERFTRVKHSGNIPVKSILYCLNHLEITSINDVDYIAFSQNSIPHKARLLFGLEGKTGNLKDKVKSSVKNILGFVADGIPIYFPDLKIKDPSKGLFTEHHLAHAASAYYTQKHTDNCLVFTIDGIGGGVSTAVWLAKGNEITPLVKYGAEGGLGYPYSIVTEALHWIHGDGEGKTMGLAPYGNYEKCKGILDDIYPTFSEERLTKKASINKGTYWEESGSAQFHMEEAEKVRDYTLQYGKENVAAEAQRKLEENAMNLIFGWCKKKGIKNIACAGGVFLNVKLNQRIWNSRGSIIENQHIYPNPADSGLAVGAALNAYYRYNKFNGYEIDSLSKGPSYTNHQIEEILKIRKLKFEYLTNPSARGAELLARNKIIAWFQGRMEAGPRSLGNRSILMSPNRAENKDIINSNVKFREGFRPFCPSILFEKRHQYLKDVRDEFFMITSFDVQDEKKNAIAAVVHVDGTGRPQLVTRERDQVYWELINAFGELTGEYVLLNTSFNIMGEPIINTPGEAIRGFFDSGIDALILNNYLILK